MKTYTNTEYMNAIYMHAVWVMSLSSYKTWFILTWNDYNIHSVYLSLASC